MPEKTIELGWAARPIKEQHPCLPDEIAARLDRDNQDLSRLRIRGLISDAEMRAIRKRLVKEIDRAIRAVSPAQS